MKDKFDILKTCIKEKQFEEFSYLLASFIKEEFPIDLVEYEFASWSDFPNGIESSVYEEVRESKYVSLLHIAITSYEAEDDRFIKILLENGANSNLKCEVSREMQEIRENGFSLDIRGKRSFESKKLPTELVKNKDLRLIAYLHSYGASLKEGSFTSEEQKEIEEQSKRYKEERAQTSIPLKNEVIIQIEKNSISKKNFFSEQSDELRKRKRSESSDDDYDSKRKCFDLEEQNITSNKKN